MKQSENIFRILIIIIAISFSLVFISCNRIMFTNSVISTVPEDKPHGYIQFYYNPKQPTTFDNYAYVYEGSKSIGKAIKTTKTSPTYLQIIAYPGLHEYTIEVSQTRVIVPITVEQNKIVPVRINITETGRNTQTYGMTKQISISFNLAADVIQSMPFETTSAINSLIDYLSSYDWETRWFAAFLLGDLKALQAKIPLENLSRNDLDKDVRKCAEWALKQIVK